MAKPNGNPIQLILRTSERRDLKRCPLRWWWAWRAGLTPNAVDSKLWFGGGIHDALAQWYLAGLERGPHPAETFARWCLNEEHYIRTKNGLFDQPKWIDARDLGLQLLIAYVDHYGRDDNWDVIATEQPFEVAIGGIGTIYSGTFDGVYRDRRTGKIWLMEHKTANQTPATGYLELDDQAGSYYAFAEIILKHLGIMQKDEHIEGIMYNFLRKGLPDMRPQNEKGQYLNKNGTVSKVQPKPLFMRHPVFRTEKQRAKMIDEIKAEVQLIEMYRTHQLPLTYTPTKDCSWDCSFYQMCQLYQSGDDWKEFRDAMFTRRDPYLDHRLALKDAEIQ
jgi:hypothetical protein